MLGGIVLAGGRSSRLGTNKALLERGGRRLLDDVVEALAGLAVVVVAPSDTTVPDGVVRTLEAPPFGGPAAGIVAGLAALDPACGEVVVLACDLPGAAGAVGLLRAAEPGPDGVVLVDDTGQRQLLAGRYRRAALVRCVARYGSARDMSVRAFMADLDLVTVSAPPEMTADIDDRGDAAHWGYH